MLEDGAVHYPGGKRYKRISEHPECKVLLLHDVEVNGQEEEHEDGEGVVRRNGGERQNDVERQGDGRRQNGVEHPNDAVASTSHQGAIDAIASTSRQRDENAGAGASSGQPSVSLELNSKVRVALNEIRGFFKFKRALSPLSNENDQNVLNVGDDLWDTQYVFADDGCGGGSEGYPFVRDFNREMFVKVAKEEILKVKLDFFKLGRADIDIKVSRMCHSKRFWLAVKFCRQYKRTGLNQEQICDIFMIGKKSVEKYCLNDNRNISYLDFDGFAPIEYEKNYKYNRQFVRDNALDYDGLVARGIIEPDGEKRKRDQ